MNPIHGERGKMYYAMACQSPDCKEKIYVHTTPLRKIMFKNFGLITLTLAAGTLLYGCATYKTTLTDAQGKSVTCEASGHAGIVTGQYLKAGFDECVKNAEAQGFKQNDATAK